MQKEYSWIFFKASVHHTLKLSHWDVPRNLHTFLCNQQHYLWIIQNCQVFSMQILIFSSPLKCMVQNKTFECSLPFELAQRGFMDKKSNCWVFSMLQVLYYIPLQNILTMSTSQVATSLSRVNTRVPMSIMQL